MRRTSFALLGALALAAPAAAQDVLEQGRAHGVEPPRWVLDALRDDPGAFEFQRAWRQRVEAIRARRAELERAGHAPFLSAAELRSAGAAVTGTLRVPVIAGLYADRAAPHPRAAYQERLFGPGTDGYSARTFYREMSRGVFELDGTVTEWLRVPGTAAYYEPVPGSGERYGRTGAFLRDALLAADAVLDFGAFDNDGPDGIPNSGDDDGYVDAAAFIYPASGMSCGGPGIWPHRWVYRAHFGAPFTTKDPSARGGFILVDDYLIQGGIDCDRVSLMPIGTFSHEMGHALALPDLYDTGGSSSGVGEWDLMGSGNWRVQYSPAHMGAWSKDFLGWVDVQTVTASATAQTLAPVYEAGRVLRFDLPFTREYLLFEHRRASGSDAFIRGAGLLAWHIDPDVIAANRSSNRVNAGAIHGVALKEADGRADLRAGRNRGDAGDPFPGSTGAASLGLGTTPSTRSNRGLPSGFGLGEIRYDGGALGFSIEVGDPVITIAGRAPLHELAAPGGTETLFRIRVPAGSTRLEVATAGGTGNANLYVDRRTRDAWTAPLACTSVASTNDDRCVVADPAPGVWHVSLYGSTAFSGVTLTALATRIAGDVSGDGEVSAQDALAVLSSVVGRALPEEWDLPVGGDATCDGDVTAFDAQVILARAVGLDVSKFCVGTVR